MEWGIDSSLAKRCLGSPSAWPSAEPFVRRVVRSVALAALSLLDAAFQLVCAALKLVATVLILPVALAAALVGSTTLLLFVRHSTGILFCHIGNALSFGVLALGSPLLAFRWTSEEDEEFKKLEQQISSGTLNLAEEVAYINSLPLCWRKRAHFEAILQTQYRLEDVEGDGNCGLRAIVRSLQPQISREAEDAEILRMREEMIAFMRTHRDEYKNFMEGVNVNDPATLDTKFDAYLMRMARNGTWIGNLELEALSRSLNLQIHVFSCDAPRLSKEGRLTPSKEQIFGDEKNPLARIYYDPYGVHFQAVYEKHR